MTTSTLRRVSCFLALVPCILVAQRQPGHPIGKVTTIGNLIHLELDTGVSHERLFDLDHRTLRFTPDGAGYRVENVGLVWDADFGQPLTDPTFALKNFSFPFSRPSPALLLNILKLSRSAKGDFENGA